VECQDNDRRGAAYGVRRQENVARGERAKPASPYPWSNTTSPANPHHGREIWCLFDLALVNFLV
jgi:hypothetical protein